MKTHSLIIVITCLIVSGFMSCNPPASPSLTEEDKNYFRDVMTQVQDDWNRGERETYVKRYSVDALYMAPHMETVIGRNAIRTHVNSVPADVQFKIPIVEIMGSADCAYVRGTFVGTNSTGALIDKGKYLSIWKKSPENQWQLIRDIFNSDLPENVALEETEPKK